MALRLKPIIQAKAKERQGTRNDLNITQKSAESNKSKSRETRDELAGGRPEVDYAMTIDMVKEILTYVSCVKIVYE